MGCQGSSIFPFTEPITLSLSPGHAVEASPPLIPGTPPPCSCPSWSTAPHSCRTHLPPLLQQLPGPAFTTPLCTSSEINRRYSTQAGSDLSPRWPGHTWHMATSCCCYMSPGVGPAPCRVCIPVGRPCFMLGGGVLVPKGQSPAPCQGHGILIPVSQTCSSRGDGIPVPKGHSPAPPPFSARNNFCPVAGPWHLGWSPGRVGASSRSPRVPRRASKGHRVLVAAAWLRPHPQHSRRSIFSSPEASEVSPGQVGKVRSHVGLSRWVG